MSSYAVTGKLYLGPITAVTGTSGTLISQAEGRTYGLNVARRVRTFRVGLAHDNLVTRFRGTVPTLRLRLRDIAAASIQTLLSGLSAAGTSVGPNATKSEASCPSLALIIRPLVTTEKYLYIPAAQLAPSTPDMSIFYSPDVEVFSEAEVHLMPSRPASQSTPAWLWASSAVIASTYSITE